MKVDVSETSTFGCEHNRVCAGLRTVLLSVYFAEVLKINIKDVVVRITDNSILDSDLTCGLVLQEAICFT